MEATERERLAVSADQIGALQIVPIGVRTWRRMDAAGKVPPPIRLGGRKLWRTSDLHQWVEWGCPERAEFEQRRRDQQDGSEM